jgi:hypothetical protein
LRFSVRRHFAYLADDGEEWDYAETVNDAKLSRYENPWCESHEGVDHENRSAIFDAWDALPDFNKAWFTVAAVLPFESMLDIDEKGDEHFGGPHIYTTEFDAKQGPFRGLVADLSTTGIHSEARSGAAKENRRVVKFPRELRGGGNQKG